MRGLISNSYMHAFFHNLLDLILDAAPWLVLGLVIGGMMKSLLPERLLQKHLQSDSLWSVIKAALLGIPLPLCSCGVVPAALGLRRAGASRAATVSFLVSTPETGVDSISVSYAMLGPVMTIARPAAAFISAVTAGVLVGRGAGNPTLPVDIEIPCCSTESSGDSCCTTGDHLESGRNNGYLDGIRYAFTDLLDSILYWLIIGVAFSAAVKTWLPPDFLADWGSGLPAMLVMIAVSIPMYVCATASTPIAAGLLLSGISPGTVLVFLLAGPASNIGSLGIIAQQLGRGAMLAYLSGVTVTAVVSGLFLDYVITSWSINIAAQLGASEHLLPQWLAWISVAILTLAALNLLRGNQQRD